MRDTKCTTQSCITKEFAVAAPAADCSVGQHADLPNIDLRERFAQFGLELHPEKTRLIEFGRFAARDRERRGDRKPETFTFLGFTHICATDRH